MTGSPAAAAPPHARSLGERIRDLTGLVFTDGRQDTLSSGLMKGMRRAGIRDLEAYLSKLQAEPAVLDDLVAEITVGETYFFRDPEQCRLIRDGILPDLLRRCSGAPLRIWSAGCATGEEAYTLAILHADAGAPAPARIVGTDLSRSALARARRARYGRWALRGLRPEDVARHFGQSGDDFVLRPEITCAVDFRYLNLAEDAYPSLASGISAMDLILCRNVLIYFDAAVAARVIRRLMESLAPGGWLLLGASDPLPADPGPCEVVHTGAGLAYRRGGTRAWAWRTEPAAARPSAPVDPPVCSPSPPPPAEALPPPSPPPQPSSPPPPETDLHAAVARVRSLANAGSLEEAGGACAAALDRHRTSAELTYLLGALLSEAGRPAEAAATLRAALYLDRTLAVAHLALGGALARVGDDAGACRALRNAERLLASQPSDAEVPASDGERAGRLAAAARAQLALLTGAVVP